MKIRLSLIFVILSVFFLSCSNGISQTGEGYVTVDLNEFVQRISSRSAVSGQPADVTLWTEGDYQTSVTQTVTDNGSEPIILDNIPVNSSISINIEAAIGRKNYLGASEKIVVKRGNNSVTIRLKKTLPTTDIVLYNQTAEGYSYYLANSTGTNLNSPAQFLGPVYNLADFCFDSNGNVYLGTNTDVMQFYSYDVSKKQVYQIQTEQISDSGFLDYDFAKNELWFGIDRKLYKFSQLNENSPDSYSANVTVYNFRTTDLGVGSLLSACIYNDKAYLVYSTVDNNDVPYVLLEYDISSAVVDEEEPTQFSIVTPKATKDLCAEMGLSSYATITDMLYQDGAVYILVRDYNFDNQYTKISRGAVLRYNTLTGSLDSLGFADSVDNASLANTKISAYNYIFDADAYKPLYNDENRTTQWFVNADKGFTDNDSGEQKNLYNEFPGIFTPAIASSISTKQFYGPSKFVAVKPKKLVIADDGIAFYTDNDVLKYKNVNRIVTVDLNSFAIVGTEDAAVNFNGESRDEIELLNVSNSTSYQNAMEDEDFPKYYENDDGTSIELTSVAAGNINLAVPCGD